MDEKLMEARCPECGSHDVDLSFSLNPIEDGVKCYDCGHVYQLGADTGVELEEGWEDQMKSEGYRLVPWTRTTIEMLKRKFSAWMN